MSDAATETDDRLTHESARGRFERIYALLNEHDTGHVPAMFTEDVEFHDDAWPEVVRGHREMEGFLGALWRAIPDFRFELQEDPYLSPDGRSAAVHVRGAGTVTGPLERPGFAPTDGRLEVEYGGFYEFEGERVKRARIIINMLDAGAQLGALPAPGSFGEKVGARAQHLTAWWMRRRARS